MNLFLYWNKLNPGRHPGYTSISVQRNRWEPQNLNHYRQESVATSILGMHANNIMYTYVQELKKCWKKGSFSFTCTV